jgi:hypothetical protein
MLTKIYFGLLFLIFSCLVAVGQETYNPFKTFSKAQLLEDADYLAEYLVKAHPAIYWHSSEVEFQQAISKLKESLSEEMTELEFLAEAAKLNSVIKCVHSDIRPSSAYNNYWKDSTLLIPINIAKVGSVYMIQQNLSETADLRFGTKIISINDEPIEAIVAKLTPVIPADGDNQTRKYDALTRGFYRYYSYFLDCTSDEFNIEIETAHGTFKEVNVAGISKAQFDAKRKTITNNDVAPVDFKILDNLTAVLTINSFRSDLMEKHQIVFKDFMSECFEQMKKQKIQNLIIDLRGNGGGYSEYAAELYSYLTDTAYQYCKRQTLTTDHLIEGIEYDIPETFAEFPDGIILENGQYTWPKHSVLGWREPATNRFKGEVYFLIDGGGVSTTSELASLAKSNGIGIFVGEEVGGTYVGNSGGVLGWIELPNTKLKVRIAMVKYEIAGDESSSRNGVKPDIQVDYSIPDLIAGKDLEIDLTLEHIAEQHSK